MTGSACLLPYSGKDTQHAATIFEFSAAAKYPLKAERTERFCGWGDVN